MWIYHSDNYFHLLALTLKKIGQAHPSLNMTLSVIIWIAAINMEVIHIVGVEILYS